MLMQNPSFFTLDTNHYITFMYRDIKNITFENTKVNKKHTSHDTHAPWLNIYNWSFHPYCGFLPPLPVLR